MSEDKFGILDIDPGRLMALTDGIFGMVMTLLIFGIELPLGEFTSEFAFQSFFVGIFPMLARFGTCFILVGAFWVYHHEYIKVTKLTVPFVWMNLIYLLCISFIPFSTMIMGKFAVFWEAESLFALNVLLIIILLIIMFFYAEKTEILEEEKVKDKKHIHRTLLLIVLITIIVTALNFTIPGHYIYLYLLIPIVSSLRDIRFRHLLKI